MINFPLTFQFENLREDYLYLPEYNLFWVFISIVIAVLSAYAALAASIRYQAKTDFLSKTIWIVISSFTLGVGIWAMHFVGMLAIELPCHVSFDLITTSVSIIPSIIVTSIVWYNIERFPVWLNSLLFGSGVGAMHYTGMAAIQLSSGDVRYDPELFVISIFVAVFLSYFALLIRKSAVTFITKYYLSIDALIMGLAVSGMHYTAMSATYFVKNENMMSFDAGISENAIAMIVSVTSIIMALSALTLAIFSKNKDIAQNLAKSNSQLSLLLNSMAEGAYGVDTNGYCQFVNDSFSKILGFEKEEVIGKHIHTLIHHTRANGQPYPSQECKMYRAYRNRESVHVNDEVFWTKNGQAIPVEYWSSVIEVNGVVLGAIATFIDITERKKAEMELRIAATAFETSQGMLVTNERQQIMRVNNAFTSITGYQPEEVVGKNPRILSSKEHDSKFYEKMWNDIVNKGSWEGEIHNCRKGGHVYPEHLSITAVKDAEGNITNYVAAFTDLTSIKNAAEEIEHLAFFDTLTDLPNRRFLLDKLKHLLVANKQNQLKGALLIIDMDDFKRLNESLGHEIGDLLLKQVARRLENCLGYADILARLGDDEFVIVIGDLSEKEIQTARKAQKLAEKVLSKLVEEYKLRHHIYQGSPSIGISVFSFDDVNHVDVILKQADIAMHQAKKAGKNTFCFFHKNMQADIEKRIFLEKNFVTALKENQFELYYQAQVNDKIGITGAEVLVRWIHPTLGILSPIDFISFAEESGLILSLGTWIIENACEQIRIWHRNPSTQHLQLAVNVSAKQFSQPDFVEQIQKVLTNSGIIPNRLKLELTESLLLDNVDEIIEKMHSLKKMGIHLSMDDFGTGYSSLSYLTKLPLDQLKIDQSFIRNMIEKKTDLIIVKMIIDMTENLEIDIIAEGVETLAQKDILKEIRCENYQGYLFSKPIPINLFQKIIEK